jgi:phosphoglycolate phosphatase
MAALSATFPTVVLDLDGTMIETAPDLCAALNHVLAAEGRPGLAVDEVRDLIGEGARRLIERGLGASGPEPDAERIEALLPAFLEFYGANVAQMSAPFPGVRDTLATLKAQGARLGVCTNKPHGLTRKLLQALDMEGCFEAVLGGDSLTVRKPDPGHLLGTIEAMGGERAGAVMVGDSPIDVACARAAGVPVVAVSYGYSRVAAAELGADLVIENFAELPAALARLA